MNSTMKYDQGYLKLENAKLSTILKACLVLGCRIEDIIEDPETAELFQAYKKGRA